MVSLQPRMRSAPSDEESAAHRCGRSRSRRISGRPGIDGDTAANGVGAEIDTDYRFLSLDNLDFALALGVEARKGRWAALFDAMRVDFSDAFG